MLESAKVIMQVIVNAQSRCKGAEVIYGGTEQVQQVQMKVQSAQRCSCAGVHMLYLAYVTQPMGIYWLSDIS